MKKLIPLAGVLALLFALAGAVAFLPADQAAAQGPSGLEGSRWRLVSYLDEAGNPAEALPDAVATAEFRDGKVSGATGCNTYTAPYEAADGKLTVGLTATTMKMCAMPIMDQEAAYLKDIQAAASYQITGDQLTIADEQGATLLTFQAEQPGALTGVTWRMTAYNNGKGGVQSALAAVRVTAVFDADGRITGSAGCNTYTAAYAIEGDEIQIKPAAATRKACLPPVMNQEIAYLEALGAAATFAIAGDQLTISDAQGATLLTFRAEQPGALTGVTWRMTAYNNGKGGVESAWTTVRVTAIFAEDGAVAGNAGCNTYSASYEIQDGQLTVGKAISTLMSCEPGIMDQERAYLTALQAAASYEIDGDRLKISDADGATLLTFQAEAVETLPGTAWTMTYYNNGKGGFQSALADVEVTAVFGDDGKLTGSGGCNTYAASYTVEGDRIEIGPALATKMACPQPIMDQEAAYFQALASAATFKVDGDRLSMRTAEDASAVAFIRGSDAATVQPEPAPEATAMPPAPAPAQGEMVYVTILPAADASMRSIALTLKPDGSAEFVQDFGLLKTVVEMGTWEKSDDGYIVTLTGQSDRKYEQPVVLKFRSTDTYLTLVDYDRSRWGEEGLKLNLAADVARKVRSALVTLDMMAGFPQDPTFVSVNGGGEVDARLLGSGCLGYINRQPVVKVNWGGSADRARIFFVSDGNPTLVVLTPQGELVCNDNAHAQLLDPFIEIEQPAAGEYRIWVGSTARNQLVPGILVLTTKSDVDLGTFELGKLIKRPNIPQKTIQPTTPVALNAEVQALFDNVVQAAPTLKPGATASVEVTAQGTVPLFRIPEARNNGCAGLVTGAPSYVFKWRGATDALRVAFEGDADSSLMVVGQASKIVLCNDDAQPDTIHPAIDIPEPAEDTYLVYVGRINPEQPVKGTLTVVETDKE